MCKKAVQQGRSERRGESYSGPYVEPLSDARTPLADFFRILLMLARTTCRMCLPPQVAARSEGERRRPTEVAYGPGGSKDTSLMGTDISDFAHRRAALSWRRSQPDLPFHLHREVLAYLEIFFPRVNRKFREPLTDIAYRKLI